MTRSPLRYTDACQQVVDWAGREGRKTYEGMRKWTVARRGDLAQTTLPPPSSDLHLSRSIHVKCISLLTPFLKPWNMPLKDYLSEPFLPPCFNTPVETILFLPPKNSSTGLLSSIKIWIMNSHWSFHLVIKIQISALKWENINFPRIPRNDGSCARSFHCRILTITVQFPS